MSWVLSLRVSFGVKVGHQHSIFFFEHAEIVDEHSFLGNNATTKTLLNARGPIAWGSFWGPIQQSAGKNKQLLSMAKSSMIIVIFGTV